MPLWLELCRGRCPGGANVVHSRLRLPHGTRESRDVHAVTIKSAHPSSLTPPRRPRHATSQRRGGGQRRRYRWQETKHDNAPASRLIAPVTRRLINSGTTTRRTDGRTIGRTDADGPTNLQRTRPDGTMRATARHNKLLVRLSLRPDAQAHVRYIT